QASVDERSTSPCEGNHRPMNTLIKIFFVLLLFVLAPSPSHACLMVDQYRTLPLGAANDEVIAFEMDQFRDGDLEMAQTSWSVSAKLIALDASGTRRVLESYAVVEMKSKDYDATMAPIFEQALKDARA